MEGLGGDRLNGHEFEQIPGDSEGWGSLACCSPWSSKELDMIYAGGTGTAGVSLFMACGVTAQWGRAVGAWGAWEAGDGDDGGGSAGAHLPV